MVVVQVVVVVQAVEMLQMVEMLFLCRYLCLTTFYLSIRFQPETFRTIVKYLLFFTVGCT